MSIVDFTYVAYNKPFYSFIMPLHKIANYFFVLTH